MIPYMIKVLCHDFPFTERSFVTINLRERKWFSSCSNNPHKNNITKYIELVSRLLETFTTKYDNTILFGDFNLCVDDNALYC